MGTPVLFLNDATPKSVIVDLMSSLALGDTVASVSSVTVYPAGDPSLVASAVKSTDSSILVQAQGGTQDTQYGLTINVLTTNGVTLSTQVAVVVSTDWASNVAANDTYSFAALMEDILAGDSAIGKATFQFPAGFDADEGEVSWTLVDREGTVYATGGAYDYTITPSPFSTLVEAHAVVGVPSAVPPSSEGHVYQVRWALTLPGSAVPTFQFQAIKVSGLTSAPEGTEPQVEMQDDQISATLSIPNKCSYVSMEVWGARNQLIVARDIIPILAPMQTAGGWLYRANIDPLNLGIDPMPFRASLDPYLLMWLYRNEGPNSTALMRQSTECWVLTSSMYNAIDDVRRRVMKARTTLFGFADMMFDTGTILGWLRRARDQFNGAAGMFTEFSMTNATGIIRELWLQFAEVEMLYAQALAEGEKAFDFQGAAIQLTVDRTQYYDSAADKLRQRLEQEAKPVKTNLIKKGATGGDGDMTGVANSAHGASRLGINISPASQIPRNRGFYRTPGY